MTNQIMQSLKYLKYIFLYVAMAIGCYLSDDFATLKLRDHADRISHPAEELLSGVQILAKFSHDALIDNKIYYVFYSDTMLYGGKRRGYLLASNIPNEGNWNFKYIITDNINKYALMKTCSSGKVTWEPLIADAVIDNKQYHYDIGGPCSSYDLSWVKRSRAEYFLTKGLFIISIPYDVVTLPVLAIKVLTIPW